MEGVASNIWLFPATRGINYPRVTESKNALRRKGKPRDRVFYGIRLKTDEHLENVSSEAVEQTVTQMTLDISNKNEISDSKG